MIRSSATDKDTLTDLYRKLMGTIRENIEKMSKSKSFNYALRAFAVEPYVVKRIDSHILKLSENMSSHDLVEIFNTKSILRQKNFSVLETCALNIIKRKNSEHLGIEDIHKCLLTCGVLSFYDNQFFTTLLDHFVHEMRQNETNSNWFKENASNLNAIMNSIGILKLHDEKNLNEICEILNKNKPSVGSEIVVNFLMSCAHVNYIPEKKKLQNLASIIKLQQFNTKNKIDCTKLLNLVWSLCVLNVNTRQDLVNLVLDEKFWSVLLDCKYEK